MMLIARAGTPLDDIRPFWPRGRRLAFEPPDMRGFWAGLSRADHRRRGGGQCLRSTAAGGGACRDHLLGLRFMDGQGRIIRNGGRVMKNVTALIWAN